MSAKPPSSANATVNKLMAKVAELDTLWSMEDDLCNIALEEGTPQGDKRASEHYAKCMDISKQRTAIHEQISALIDKENRRMDKFLANKALPLPKGGKTRRGGRTMPKTRRNKASGGDIVSHLLTIRNQIKLYHWQTKQFARHKATDDLTAALDLNIDAFVESYMGRYGRPTVSGGIKLHNFSEAAAKTFVAKETKYLETELPRKIGKNDTDLLNLRDTILGDLTKVSYLFTLA
jgi:hypothetical protein